MTKHFSTFRFDVEDGTLWRGAEQVPLTGKAASLLRCLLGEGRLVGVQVHDHVGRLAGYARPAGEHQGARPRESARRSATSPGTATFIKSAPGRGYSFIADVSQPNAAVAADAPSAARRRCSSTAGRSWRRSPMPSMPCARRRAGSSSISGEHGSGKTALCDAFVRTAHAAGPVRVCYGQCFDRELPHERYYPFLDALIALDRRHPGLVPRVLAQHAPSWLAQFPQWIGAGAPTVHAVRMLDELGAALAALSHDLPAGPHPRGSAVGRCRHRQRARPPDAESDALQAADRRHVLRGRMDGGPEGPIPA